MNPHSCDYSQQLLTPKGVSVGLLPPGAEVALFMDALSGLARITCMSDEGCLCVLMLCTIA